ncbi:MAG: TIGR02466 family protein [Pseudomonadota bacterium]
MSQRALFPTLIHQGRLDAPDLVADLEAACWMIEEGDQAGHAWCEREGYPGYTSYASLDDLPSRAPAFGALASYLLKEAQAFAKALSWEMEGKRLVPSGFWVNILGEGMGHSGHIHPGSVISGTVYVAMPKGAGALRFEDPRLAMMMAAPPARDDAPEDARRFVYISPHTGDILMWESWLRHEVMASRTEDPRISISFNFAAEPT